MHHFITTEESLEDAKAYLPVDQAIEVELGCEYWSFPYGESKLTGWITKWPGGRAAIAWNGDSIWGSWRIRNDGGFVMVTETDQEFEADGTEITKLIGTLVSPLRPESNDTEDIFDSYAKIGELNAIDAQWDKFNSQIGGLEITIDDPPDYAEDGEYYGIEVRANLLNYLEEILPEGWQLEIQR